MTKIPKKHHTIRADVLPSDSEDLFNLLEMSRALYFVKEDFTNLHELLKMYLTSGPHEVRNFLEVTSGSYFRRAGTSKHLMKNFLGLARLANVNM